MSSELLASKIVIEEEDPQVRAIAGVPTSVVGFIGVCEKGPIGVATPITSPDGYNSVFGGYTANGDVRQAVDGFYQNAGSGLIYVTRTVHYSDVTDPATKTSAQAEITLQTGAVAASGGKVTGTNVGPFNLEPGDTIIVDTEAISPTTTTFLATAGARESTNAQATPFALSDGMILNVKINAQSVAQAITFHTASFADITNATAVEICAVINAQLTGGSASTSSGGTKVTITSDRRGTSSSVQVTGGTANVAGALNFATGLAAGTGNVADIDAVTVAEIKTAVELAVTGVLVTNVGGAVRITRSTATGGSATVQVTAGSTADDELGLDNAIHAGASGSSVDTLKLKGKTDGTFANALKGKVLNATSGDAAFFNLQVIKNGVTIETFPNVTMLDTDPRYVETVVNDVTTGSKYIAAEDQDAATGDPATDRPVNVTSSFLAGGNDGLGSLADTDFTGASSDAGKTGIRAFDSVQDLAVIVAPGRATSAVHNALISYCEVTRDKQVFTILDPPAGLSATDVVDYFANTAAVIGLSEFGAAYWPRIKVLNPSTSVFGTTSDGNITVPPSGHIAGVYARTDAKKDGGIYLQPAGIEDGILFGCLGFETDTVLEQDVRDIVYPKLINPLTALRGGPRHIDGTANLKATGNFPSIAERRGAIFIEQSVKDGLQFARHKGNTETLRATCDRSVRAFLLIQMKNGAFRSQDPAKAFSVDFDVPGVSLNSPAVQFAKKLVGRVGIATVKPAEFIVLKFAQDTRALEEELAA